MILKRVFKKMYRRVDELVSSFSYRIYKKRHRSIKKFVIISRDCIGGVIYNQYGMQFISPTINLFFSLEDFNYFCLDLEGYLHGSLCESNENSNYPIGILKSVNGLFPPIRIHFIHYDSFETAYKKWHERKNRIDDSYKIYVVNNATNDCEINEINDEIIRDFNKIKFKKVCFVRQNVGFEDEFVLKPLNNNYHNAYVLDKKHFTYKRVINDFDFDTFFDVNKSK